jgi:DNA-binding CsgD family transcriptional regulator
MARERWPEATNLLNIVIRSSETSGIMARSAFARVLLAETLWRTGRWAESLAETSQSQTLQEAIRPGQVVPGTLAMMARLEAGFGQPDSCRAHVARVLDAPPAIEIFTVIALSAAGLLELGLGHHADAAAAFDGVAARAGHVGDPGWLWWQGDAIEAYAGCGRLDDSNHALARLEEQASTTAERWPLAAVDRAHGMLGTSGPCDDRLTAALDGFRDLGAPFEVARTLLVRGRWRMREGARVDGGRDVAAARTIFDRLGARAWSEQASAIRGEVTGVGRSLTSQLTPAELRVALTVGRGTSNREAAEQLFISVKTVDYHLQSIYRKLGLRNRSQLTALVQADTRPGT